MFPKKERGGGEGEGGKKKKIEDTLWCIAPVVDSWVSQCIAGQLSQATGMLRTSMRQVTSLSPSDITELHIILRTAYLLSRGDITEICNLDRHQQ